MELLQVIEGHAKRFLEANQDRGHMWLMSTNLIHKPKDIPADAMPYRAPNGLWFWAVPSKKETVQ